MGDRASEDDNRRRALAWFLVVAAVVVGLDLASKWAAFRYLDPSVPHVLLPGCLNLRLSMNPGAVFGIGRGMRVVFVVFTVIAAAGIVWAQWRHGTSSAWLNFGLGFLLGGALGNLYDRLVIGEVRDFIDAYLGNKHWPTFNVADMAICIGCGLIILCSFRAPKEEGKANAAGSKRK